MPQPTKTKSEIIALLEGRCAESLQAIHQFILDIDELDYCEFLYPSDPDLTEDLDERDAEAEEMLQNLKEIQATLFRLEQGQIKQQ